MSRFVQADGRVIHPQTHLTKEQKQAVGLLSIGTFLEYFDLLLYVHMAAFLNELFFEPTDPYTTSLMTAFAFCSTYVFRPIGALIFGWLGDNIGRKSTVIITTFMMAASCLVMANLPTYAQIGSVAAWIVTICRIVQGMSSMGEIVGAELYITETINPPAQYVSVALIGAFSCLGGGIAALGIASLVTSYAFNWRAAFWLGAIVALIGSIARTTLRETPEFADAKRQLKKVFAQTNTDISTLESHPIWKEKVKKKTFIALLLIQCVTPVCFYFIYMHCGTILKTNFGYTTSEVIHHNFIVAIIQFLSVLTLAYLSYKIYPLVILKIILIIFSIFVLFCPYWLNNLHSPYELFLIQSIVTLFAQCEAPADPIFYKSFPVFKRFTSITVIFALSRAFMYVITSFGFAYLTKYFGNWGLLIIMIPINIGFAFGLLHFEKLEKKRENYFQPKIDLASKAG
ncbi:MAG: MFS transporter [Rickettsia endosymbiont of Sergentomyia squamirostris]|uniref:MFS transporter n=1 Tax=Candidatus Tisiphia endosymbiont of Sergentomyia squamirostris TaxID=3113639 RepID=A0AAT9G970_9RICK